MQCYTNTNNDTNNDIMEVAILLKQQVPVAYR